MKSAILAIATLAASTQAYSTVDAFAQDFAIIRGSIQGFRRGLYSDRKYNLDANCLGDTTVSAIAQLMHPVASHNEESGESIFFETLTSIYHVMGFNDKYCGFEGLFADMYSHCLHNSDKPCTFNKMLARAQKDAFKLISQVNDIALQYSEEAPESAEELEYFYTEAGEDIGSVLDILIHFPKASRK